MAEPAEKSRKDKKEAGVLGGLSTTRPSRMNRRARTSGAPADARSSLSVDATRAAATRAAATRDATGAAAGRAGGKRSTAAEKTGRAATAAKPKSKPKPAVAAKPDAKPVTAKPVAERPAPAPKPRAVRLASHALSEPTAKADALRKEAASGRPGQSGTELVGTVVQAAGELASIGLTVGGQILRRAAEKFPRP